MRGMELWGKAISFGEKGWFEKSSVVMIRIVSWSVCVL